jgi:hypothetical protein
MNVKSTFLNEDLGERYMEQPEGFILPKIEKQKSVNW